MEWNSYMLTDYSISTGSAKEHKVEDPTPIQTIINKVKNCKFIF